MKALLLFFAILLSLNIQAFTLVGSTVATYSKPEITITIGDASCSDLDDSPEEIRDITRKAVDKFWNRVSTSAIELKVDGLENVDASFYTDEICNTGAGCVPSVKSGVLIVCSTNGASFPSSGRLAVTLPNNISGTTIKGGIIAINAITGTKFNELNENEKISTIAHELGHAFGLGHSQFEDSLMYSKSVDGRNRLGRDDWDGATFLYPKEQGPAAFCGTIDFSQGPRNGAFIYAFLFLIILLFLHKFTILKN